MDNQQQSNKAKTISREAHDTSKGFRLQKIRAVSLMLQLIEENDNKFLHIFGGVEYFEDVYITNQTNESVEYFEEDKYYDKDKSFTMNSHEVKNTLVSFIDIWIGRGNGIDKNLHFLFNATNKVGGERDTDKNKKLGINIVDKDKSGNPIKHEVLKELSKNDIKNVDSVIINYVKKYIIAEYDRQYSKERFNGYIDIIKDWSDEDWRDFLGQVRWSFEQEDEYKLKKRVLKQIKASKYFTTRHPDGCEAQIFDSLMELFDSRKSTKKLSERFVHVAEIYKVFSETLINLPVSQRRNKQSDSVWEMWDRMPLPDGKKNVTEKFNDICPKLSKKAKGLLSQKVARSLIENKKNSTNKDFLSVRYRIYEKAQELLIILMNNHNNKWTLFSEVTENEVMKWLNDITKEVTKSINELSSTYSYPVSNSTAVEGVILELFDKCFLSFENE